MNNSKSKNKFRTLKETFLARGFIKKFELIVNETFTFKNKNMPIKKELYIIQSKNIHWLLRLQLEKVHAQVSKVMRIQFEIGTSRHAPPKAELKITCFGELPDVVLPKIAQKSQN